MPAESDKEIIGEQHAIPAFRITFLLVDVSEIPTIVDFGSRTSPKLRADIVIPATVE